MRLAFAVISVSIVLALPAKAQTWEEYRPDGIGFRIEMPGKPKLETRRTSAGNTAYHAVVSFRNMGFLVIYGEKDARRADPETLLDTVVKAFTEDKKVLSSRKETIGGYPARRVLAEDADKDQVEVRLVIADNRLIQAIFLGPAGNPVGRRFLDSLTIVEQK